MSLFLSELILHVAMQLGLYLHRRDVGVWRVVSEDSDHFGAWPAVVHALGDFDDPDQPGTGEMGVRLYQPQTFHELQEVILLGSSQRVVFEERDDRLNQITPLSHTVPMHVFLVVVVSPIEINRANPKKLHEHVETADASRALRHRKFMSHLETCSVSLSITSIGLTDEVDRKATFSIYKTCNPTYLDQPFLLIFRIRRIVTARFANTRKCLSTERVPRNTRVFQHIAKFY